MLFSQKHNRRKAAKEHVRQKLQEHTGLTPVSVHSHQSVGDDDAKTDGMLRSHVEMAKIKKCCVSFRLSSLGSACSCRSVSAEDTNVCGVSDAGPDVCATNTGLIANVPDVQDEDLFLSTDAENLQPDSRHDEPRALLTSEADVMKPDSNQSITGHNKSAHGVNLKHSAAVACTDASRQPDDHLYLEKIMATPENVNKQHTSNLCVPEKSDIREGSSSVSASSLNASQEVQSPSIQNASATPVSSGGCELNFSFMDEELLACFTHSDSFSCDLQSSEIDVCKKDISDNVCDSVERDRVAMVSGKTVGSRESESPISGDDDTASLCQALSVVKIAVAESVKSGVSDFTLPDSQYGEIIRRKVTDETCSSRTVDKDVVDEMARSFGSSSQLTLSSSGQQSIHRLQQKQWYAAGCSTFLTITLLSTAILNVFVCIFFNWQQREFVNFVCIFFQLLQI